MASALIGSLRVSLSAETSAFEAGMKRSQRTAKKTASSIESSFRGVGGSLKSGVAGFVSALSVGLLATAAKNALDLVGSLGEVSQQLGVTTKDLQVLRYAAGQSGVTQEELDTALGKLTVTLGKVAAGAKAPIEALNAIGISADQLKGKDTGEAFRIIADGLEKVTDRSQRALIETQLFGRAGAKLDTLLAGGSKAINELALAAEKLGIVLSEEEIKKADETADKLDALQTVLRAQIAGDVARNADSILSLASALSTLTGEVLKFLSSKPELALGLLGAMAGGRLGGLPGAAIGGLGGAIVGSRMRKSAADANMDPAFRAAQLRKAQQDYARAKATPASGAGFGGAGGIPISAGSGGNVQAAERELRRQTELGRQAMAAANKPKAVTAPGLNIPQFMASGGGAGGGSKDRSAEEAERKRLEALRDANDFDQQIRRANIDILHSKQALATDEVERYAISIQTKDAERAAYASQLQYEVAAGEKSAAEAEILQQKYDERDQVERSLLIAEENERARRASADVDMNALEMARDRLQSEEQVADTVAERRDVQLRILDNAYAIEKASLEDVIASREATDAQKEIARQRLLNLNKTYQNDRQGVMNNNRGPLGDYVAETEDMNTALEGVAVDGLQKLEDGLTGLIMGTKSLKEAFHDMAAAILEDLIRIMIRQLIVKALMSAFGGGFSGGGQVTGADTGAIGMASGGFVSGPGGPREDRVPAMLSNGEYVVNAKATRKFLPLLKGINEGNVARLAAGGLALPRSSMGERVSVSNDNDGGRRGVTQNFDLRGAVVTEQLYKDMQRMSAEAADRGGNLGVQRMRDLNERTFGRAGR